MPVTGLRASSMQNLVLNEGAFLVGFDYTQYNTAAALEAALVEALQDDSNLLGATNGGGTFKCVPTTRQIEIDGIRGSVKGATHVDSWDIGLTGTLKELKKSTIAKLLMCADVDETVTNLTKIKIHSDIKSSDYISYLCWVGSTPYGYMLIGMTDVLNVSGMTMTFQDKNEATVPFEFKSHSNNLTGDDELPVDMILLTTAENAEVIPPAEQGENQGGGGTGTNTEGTGTNTEGTGTNTEGTGTNTEGTGGTEGAGGTGG